MSTELLKCPTHVPEETPPSRPWRGFFSPALPRDVLFTLETNWGTASLPSWEPHITINPRWVADDDE